MLKLVRLAAVFVAFALTPFSGHAQSLPDLVFYSGNGMGGLGRLIYDSKVNLYELADGRITPHVIDQGNLNELERAIKEGRLTEAEAHERIKGALVVRAMHADEGGGTMAVPSALVAGREHIIGMLSSYNALIEFAPDGTVARQKTFGDISYQGSAGLALQRQGDTLFFMSLDGTLFAYNLALEPLGQLKVQNLGWSNGQLVITPAHAYALGITDPRPAMECAGPGACGKPFLTAVEIDITNPRDMKLVRDEKSSLEGELRGSIRYSAIDPAARAWLAAVQDYNGGWQVQLRSLNAPSQLVYNLAVQQGQVLAMTSTAPFQAVVRYGDDMVLQQIMLMDGKLALSPAVPLNLKGATDVQLARDGDKVFVAAYNQLRVVQNNSVIHAQDFNSTGGSMFSFRLVAVAPELPHKNPEPNEARIRQLLALDYWDNVKMTELEAQLKQLRPTDTWAVPLLANMLEKRGNVWNIRPILIKGLGAVGKPAQSAIPQLLGATMDGAAVNGDILPLVSKALQQIDPDGLTTSARLPEFVKSHYEAGARMVARDVLSAINSPAAQEAISLYK